MRPKLFCCTKSDITSLIVRSRSSNTGNTTILLEDDYVIADRSSDFLVVLRHSVSLLLCCVQPHIP